jgi:hypothetical protein
MRRGRQSLEFLAQGMGLTHPGSSHTLRSLCRRWGPVLPNSPHRRRRGSSGKLCRYNQPHTPENAPHGSVVVVLMRLIMLEGIGMSLSHDGCERQGGRHAALDMRRR